MCQVGGHFFILKDLLHVSGRWTFFYSQGFILKVILIRSTPSQWSVRLGCCQWWRRQIFFTIRSLFERKDDTLLIVTTLTNFWEKDDTVLILATLATATVKMGKRVRIDIFFRQATTQSQWRGQAHCWNAKQGPNNQRGLIGLIGFIGLIGLIGFIGLIGSKPQTKMGCDNLYQGLPGTGVDMETWG